MSREECPRLRQNNGGQPSRILLHCSPPPKKVDNKTAGVSSSIGEHLPALCKVLSFIPKYKKKKKKTNKAKLPPSITSCGLPAPASCSLNIKSPPWEAAIPLSGRSPELLGRLTCMFTQAHSLGQLESNWTLQAFSGRLLHTNAMLRTES